MLPTVLLRMVSLENGLTFLLTIPDISDLLKLQSLVSLFQQLLDDL